MTGYSTGVAVICSSLELGHLTSVVVRPVLSAQEHKANPEALAEGEASSTLETVISPRSFTVAKNCLESPWFHSASSNDKTNSDHLPAEGMKLSPINPDLTLPPWKGPSAPYACCTSYIIPQHHSLRIDTHFLGAVLFQDFLFPVWILSTTVSIRVQHNHKDN